MVRRTSYISFRDTMAERYSRILTEILEREKQRNEMLLDSEYAEFALSEEGVVEEVLTDHWTTAGNALVSSGDIVSAHNVTPRIVDVRSIKPNEGRRVDGDLQALIVVFEDSNSIEYPTIDYAVRNENYDFTLHLRVLHRRDFAQDGSQSNYESGLVYSRDRLQALYKIARKILEENTLNPRVYVGGGTSGTVEESAELIKLNSRSEANDRGKRLLGYKLSVEMKRMARAT